MPDIQYSMLVSAGVEHAFTVFVREFGEWWPREYTWSGDVLNAIAIEPHEGGMCYEVGPHGFRNDWGRVLAYEPPHHILFTWQVGLGRNPIPDPTKASLIEVRFKAEQSGTRVEFEHRGFARHGAEGKSYREALASPEGWPYILNRYVQAASDSTS